MKKQSIIKRPLRALFSNVDQITCDQLLASNILRDVLKVEVPKAIEIAMVNKKTFASIFEINSSASYVEIHKNYWADALDTCIRWYIEDDTEDYEFCRHMARMVETLRSGTSTLKK
jgi:hypothetical protein